MVCEIRAARLLEDSQVVWLATTCPDGTPHLVPAWFAWDGERMLIPTRHTAQKARNVRVHPDVMFGVGPTSPSFGAELLRGRAVIADVDDSVKRRFRDKYGSRFGEADFTEVSFWQRFPACVVVTPQVALDWGAREVARRSLASSFA